MGYSLAGPDFFITTITIGLQLPFKIIQYLLGSGSPSSKLLIQSHPPGNRDLIHPRPPLMARALVTGLQNLDRSLVGLQVPPDLGIGEQMLPENSQPVHRCGCPPVKGGSGNGDVFTQEPLTLAV